MPDRAHEAAAILLRVGAVNINAEEWFTYTSGIKSPIYTDNRLLISFPEERQRIVTLLAAAADEAVGLDNVDVVAGTATAGIPFAAWLADRLQRPMVYVRGSAKAHGLARQIEGRTAPGERVVVVEDLVTTGGSSLATVDALAAGELTVLCCLAIFSYGFEAARQAYASRGVTLVSLTTLDVLLDVAIAGKQITPTAANTVLAWAQQRERAG